MLNIEQLHSHFLHGNIKEQRSGKTMAVIYQAIGFLEVLDGANIYILCNQNDITHIHKTLAMELLKNFHHNFFSFVTYGEIKCLNGNHIKIQTFDKYMNHDFMSVNHKSEDHMILFDYRNMTSVNTSPETIFKIMGRTVGGVVGACGYEVSKALGGIPVNIYID